MCWWQVLIYGDNNKMLVTILAIFVASIHYFFTLASGTNIQKMSPTSKFSKQHPQIVSNFESSQVWTVNRWKWFWWHRDVGDDLWMLVTSFECWCPTLMEKDCGCWWLKRPKPSPTSWNGHQHIRLQYPSPTSLLSLLLFYFYK